MNQFHTSEEGQRRLSEASKKSYTKNEGLKAVLGTQRGFRGRTHSEETKAKMRAAKARAREAHNST